MAVPRIPHSAPAYIFLKLHTITAETPRHVTGALACGERTRVMMADKITEKVYYTLYKSIGVALSDSWTEG